MTLREWLFHLTGDPIDLLVRRWNWKSALLSSLFRGGIFFCATLPSGLRAAGGAMAAEFALRAVTAGFHGALTQSLSRVRPHWQGAFAAFVLLPLVQHGMEFSMHWLRGTPRVAAGVLASVCFTVLSTLANLHLMRNGVMVVGAESQSLGRDLARIPGLLVNGLASALRMGPGKEPVRKHEPSAAA